MKHSRNLLGGMLALALVTALPAAELGYHFQDGETWTYQVQNTASPPTQGDIVSNLVYQFHAASNGDPAALQAEITGTSTHFNIQGSQATFDLTAQGQASNLASDKLNDPVDGAFVKNAPGFFFPLPSGDVAVGESWQALQTFYFPPLDLPGSFTQLRTQTTFTYKGTEQAADGRTLHVLQMNSVQAPGAPQKVELAGTAKLDAAAGRMVSTSISGIVRVKVGFFWAKVPTSLSLVEAAPSL